MRLWKSATFSRSSILYCEVTFLRKNYKAKMVGVKKFTVVKFTGVVQPGKNPYKCVPSSWAKFENANGAVVPYPAEDQLALSFNRIYHCKLPAEGWNTYPVSIESEADSYEAGMLYIKRLNDTELDEEALMIWKQASLECLEKLGRYHPITLIYSLWSRVANLFNY
ncbi:uncharacterized protein LOC130665988 [Microplitis mediator]|uniref:uncharacterized protein LOC130665988 n=1 Tax=Microplitis mediator TaxID=375433 RepID=UPI0025559811|nr:uncharacterized protein LOC130665988 [Microplitis mediator]